MKKIFSIVFLCLMLPFVIVAFFIKLPFYGIKTQDQREGG